MKYFFVVLITLFASVGVARLSDGKVTFKVEKHGLHLGLASGFHFNKEAPASLVIGATEVAPNPKEEKSLVFDVSAVGTKVFKLGFYVCDDQKTVCEEHSYDYQILNGKVQPTGKAASLGGDSKKDATLQSGQTEASKVSVNHHGFIENDFEAALAFAKKKKQVVLVDYGAPWCPACVRLETEVFGTKEFKGLTEKTIKLYMNADIVANKAFGSKYKIKALPTLLVLNSEGEELYRSLDFKPVADLAKELKPQLKLNKNNWPAIIAKAEAGDATAILKMADQAFAKLDYEQATKWYSKLDSKTDALYAYSESNLWADKFENDKEKNKADYLEVLKKWSTKSPDTYTALSSRNDWAQVYRDAKEDMPDNLKNELQKNRALVAGLLESHAKTLAFFKAWPVSSLAPFEKAELLNQKMTSEKALQLEQEVAETKALLKTEMLQHKFSVQKPGEILVGSYYLRQAGVPEVEEKWLLELQTAQPESYVYSMRLARLYVRQNDYSKALAQAEKAVEQGADARMSNLKLLAEIQKELKQKDASKKSIDRALALPEAKHEKFQNLAKSLEEMKKGL